ncbi:RGP1 [Acrasis kona]|uniref:RGP1 n=1 Tax=Acrasis kona TaxID=1008807 RepID=A0AAW2YTL1_9EUKA
MVVVAHLLLENSLLFPGSHLKCTLNVINKSKEVLSERGSHSSNLLGIFYDESFRKVKEKVVYYTAKPRDEDFSQIWTIEKVYAQVNGHCSCDESHFGRIDQGQITYCDEEQPMEKLEPLFLKKNNMFNVFASQPKSFTQMENFTMKIDDKRTMQFSLTLPPSEIPPSYKGVHVKYSYLVNVSITVSNARQGTITKILRLPFKIYNPLASLVPTSSCLPFHHNFAWNFENIKLSERDSFYYALREIELYVKRHSTPSHYDITHRELSVCRFSLSTTAHRLGDTVLGLFDFSNRSPNISVQKLRTDLIYEETTLHANKKSQTVVSYFNYNANHMLTTNFSIMIPPHCPCSFSTDLVDVKWFLRFVFNVIYEGEKEAMEWSLPLQVFVPSDFRPLHVQSHSRETCLLYL